MRIFRQGQGHQETTRLRGDVVPPCGTQAIPPIGAEIGEIDHLWMERPMLCSPSMEDYQAKPTQPKCYTYLGSSSPERLRGDPQCRQLEASKRYAQGHDLVLDSSLTFRDLCISAFNGRNVKTGALGRFLELVGSGDMDTALFRGVVPGHIDPLRHQYSGPCYLLRSA